MQANLNHDFNHDSPIGEYGFIPEIYIRKAVYLR